MAAIRTVTAALAALGLAAACSKSESANAAPAKAPAATPAVAASAVATAAATPSADAAKVWVVRLYAEYADDQFSPFATPENWFAPDLVHELAEDERLTPAGEMGAIDADPVCSCQDPTDMKATVVEAVMTGPAAARVKLKLDWPAPPQSSEPEAYHRENILHLVLVNGAWRIRDITGGPEDEGFLANLKKGNAERAAGNPLH